MQDTSQSLESGQPVQSAKRAPKPQSIDEVKIEQRTLEYGAELNADHPGFHDTVYRARRQNVVENAYRYKPGTPLPHVEYTDVEIHTWQTIFDSLVELYPTHACKQFLKMWDVFQFSRHEIPQLQSVSDVLQKATGFTLRPVAGLLSPRDFLAGLAFRVFYSTQYIRHHSRPFYTPEPDVCHELLGHAPMLADPEFAELSQKIGQASLGASDEDVTKLARVYWFSVEFGLVREEASTSSGASGLRAYGAGLLSSFGELCYSVSGAPEYRRFDPHTASLQEYPITEYQPIIYVADSFRQAIDSVDAFSETIA